MHTVKSEFNDPTLDSSGEFQWRRTGEEHPFNPKTIHMLHMQQERTTMSCIKSFPNMVKEENIMFLRGLLDVDFTARPSIPIEEVEPMESIFLNGSNGRNVIRLDQ